MSSAGINPLAFVSPDLYVKQLAIQRRQALAQSLMEQGQGNAGSAAYGGLRNAGNEILGAFLARRGDQDMANIAPQISQAYTGGAPAPQPANPSPQISNTAASGPQQQRTISPQGGGGGIITTLPGMSPQQSMIEFFQNNGEYWKALNSQNALTDQQKQIIAAFPGDPQKQAQALQGVVNKAGSIPVTRGMVIGPDGSKTYAPPPAPAGYQYQSGPNGQAQLVPTQGGLEAVAGSAAAGGIGKAATTPAIGYDASNMPVATNQAQMLGANGPMIPGINQAATARVESNNNPNAVSPAGAVGTMQTMPGTLASPGFGVAPAANNTPAEQTRVGDDYLDAMMKRYNNPVLAHIAYNMGPGRTDAWVKAGGNFSRLPLETQQYIAKTAIAQALPQGGQAPQQSPTTAQPLRPELPAGQSQYMQSQAKDAADRHDTIVAAASESPMRINVLDNIIGLSQSGIATGPGQEWQNHVLGYIANTPGLSKVTGGVKDNLGKFQELQKFTYQNAIRSWQAAGGTGTDAQMQSMAHANPNDALFPQALQTIAKWGKAAELAVQGKANAQDQFLASNGQTPTNQIKFENEWRNSFDPKVFQYSLMSPQEKQGFAAELKTPQAAQAFIAKQQKLKALGALQ